MRLSDLQTGQSAIVVKVLGHGGFRRRIMEMGFVRGKSVEVVLNAPLKDPIKYKVLDYEVSLRRSEASMVVVITEEEALRQMSDPQWVDATVPCECIEDVIASHSRTINIALVGNPNSGKTSLFNALSGSHEHVGNYSGVTVDAKCGRFRYKGYRFIVTDLPGTYALSAYTPEERYVRHHLVAENPDVIVNAVVSSNLERNLFLTTELIDINPKMVVALNMYDELEHSGARLDYEQLGRMLGVPMVPVVAKEGKGLEALLDTVIEVHENRDERVRHIHINHGTAIEAAVNALAARMREHAGELPAHFPPRYWALKLLERDLQAEQAIAASPHREEWLALREREGERIERELGEDVETAVTNGKYGFISGALKETYTPAEKEQAQTTRLIDAIVTHKLFGFPIFFLLMWIMFAATFSLGAYPQEWIESLVESLSQWVAGVMGPGPLRDLLVSGVIGGVGSVIVFLPNILILYLFISFMEDSGYMARAAFIMDKVMHRIGLHGKSFIPLVMGFGCNVPAIMAARTIESRSSRMITIFINPFISCSARLPVYILLAGTFFPRHAGVVLVGLYLLGIAVAVLTARLMRRFMFRSDETPFVMELPPYRIPTLDATLRHMWEKCAQYLRKMGGVILVASIIIWLLSYYPRPEPATAVPAESQYADSYLGRVGHFCEPAMRPLGLDWKAGVALVSGTAAKEIVVSTLGVLYSEDDAAQEAPQAGLAERLKASNEFDARSSLAFLVFVLLYFPCIASLSAVASETGSWRWAAASALYSTLLAWVAAFIVYRIAGLF